jgi:WD40 repeat protein
MKIIKLKEEDKYQIKKILQAHTNEVCKVIEIKENELISVSRDKTMKIWKLNNENQFEYYDTITFQNSKSRCNILRLNENEFVTSSCDDKCIKFWNSNDYSNIATINNIEIELTYKTMCLLENDILCVGGTNSKGFYLIKISTHQLIKNILGPNKIFAINECLDGLFLCSIIDEKGNHCLVKYKYEEQNLKKMFEKEKAHDKDIYSCVELNDGTIASGGEGDGYSIKLWQD